MVYDLPSYGAQPGGSSPYDMPSYGTGGAAPAEKPGAIAKTLRGVSNALWYLDTPAAVVRSAVDYGIDGTWDNPFDAATRVSMDSIVEDMGVQNPVAKFAVGTGLGIALDPLTYVSGPLRALTPGGKAAAATGLLDDAAEVASRKLQKTLTQPGAAAPTGRAARALTRLKRGVTDYAEHAADPLVSPRMAQRTSNLDELIQNRISQGKWTPDSQRHLDAYLSGKGLAYDDIKSTPLSRSFGFGDIVGDPLGAAAGDAAAKFFDRIPEAVRWSPVGLAAHQWANKAVGGLYNPIGQATATGITSAGAEGAARGGRASGEVAQLVQFAKIPDAVAKRTGISDVKDVRVQEAIDRYVEGVAATANDIDLIENTPKLKELADYWAKAKVEILAESKEAGLNAHQLRHKFGASHRPYMMTTALDRTVLQNGKPKGAYFDLVTGDMIARQKSLQMPGALDQLRFYAKQPEFLMGRKDKAGKLWSQDELTDRLFREVNDPNSAYYQTVPGTAAHRTAQLMAGAKLGKNVAGPQAPRFTKGNARAVAGFLSDLDPADPVVFGNHPAEAFARYMTGRYQAIATGKALGDAVISRAVRQTAGSATGEKMVPLTEALAKVGLKSQRAVDAAGNKIVGGAQARARKALGTDDLSQFSVPESFLDRLTETQNLIRAPKEQTAVGKFLAEHMRAFKSQVLSWPSRITRDWTSGTIGNLLLVKDPTALSQSMYHTQSLLNGNYDEAVSYLKTLPAYKSMAEGGKADAEILSAYLGDLAEAGVMKGLGLVDRAVGDRTGKALLDVLPGSTPMRVPNPFNPSTIKEVLTDRNTADFYGIKGVSFGNKQRSWAQFGKDWLTDPLGSGADVKKVVRKESNNPFIRKMEQSAEWSDAHARLSGYNALLAQGVAPREAAKRLKRIHVDYESLTDFEKKIRDVVAPFYSYNVRSGQFAIEEMMNPGGAYYHALQARERLQATDENDPYLPQNYRERGGFTLSKDFVRSLGVPESAVDALMAPNGMSTVIGGIDMPGAGVLDMLSYKPSAIGWQDSLAASAGATLRNVTSQVSPVMRTVGEMMTGVDAYTRRPVGEAPSQWDKVLIGVTQDRDQRLSPITKWALDLAIPGASRIAGFVGTAADPRVDRAAATLGATWNAFAPVRHYYVDEQQRLRDERASIDEMIQRVPGRRTFSTVSIPDEVAAGLSPEFQAMLARKKEIDKELKANAKANSPAEQRAEKFRRTRPSRPKRGASNQ